MFGDKHASNMATIMVLVQVLMLITLIGIYVQLGSLRVAPSGTGAAVAAPPAGAQAPAAAPEAAALNAPTVDDDPSIGSANAPVTVIEFSDFQCPYCQRWHQQSWAQLKSEYIDTGKVLFVYRDFPLSFHVNAQQSAEASECADDQGKYWAYHDVLFEKGSGDGTGLTVTDLKQYAVDLGLNAATFNSCLDSGKYASEVAKDQADGSAAGVQGTPTFYINGVQVVGAVPYASMKAAIDAALNA